MGEKCGLKLLFHSVFVIFLLAAGQSSADLVTQGEMTAQMRQCVDALKKDGIDSSMWRKDYNCWHIARDVQKGLAQNNNMDTALRKIQYQEDGKTHDHWVLDAGWKTGKQPIFIEPGTGKLYKSALNLMQHYRVGQGIVKAEAVDEPYSRLLVDVDVQPLRIFNDTEITITVTVYDRTGAKGLLHTGKPIAGQPLTVWLTPPNGPRRQISKKGARTDPTGKWTKKVTPCPKCFGVFRVEAEAPTTPVAAKGFWEGRCIVKLGMVPRIDPGTAYCALGNEHHVTVTLLCALLGKPQANVQVLFSVIDGPHAGTSGTARTNASGRATWGYAGTKLGTDVIVASPLNSLSPDEEPGAWRENGKPSEISNPAHVTWLAKDAPTLPPSQGYAWKSILREDFEGTFPGDWELRGNDVPPVATWGKDDFRAFDGSFSAFCAKDGADGVTPPEKYPDGMASAMIYGPFDLSDADYGELNFHYWLKTADPGDRLWYLASVDGTDFFGEYRHGNSDGWQYKSFKLNDAVRLGDLTGQPRVWIAFYFVSDASGNDSGAFVDDVVLKKWVPHVAPAPAIRANGSDDRISVVQGTPVSISLGMDAGSYRGENADWWLVDILTGGMIKYFDVGRKGMVEGFYPSYQGPLFSFGDTAVLNLDNLEPGGHTFYFGVDLGVNGTLDMDSLFYDRVEVEISPP